MTNKNRKWIRKFYKSKKAREFVSYISETWFFFLRNNIYGRSPVQFDAFVTEQLRCHGHDKFKAQMLYFIALNPSLIDEDLNNFPFQF